MWLFLFTELLLFGGLFLLYAVFRFRYPSEFHSAASQLDIALGAANTAVLITSSLTMAVAVTAAKRAKKKLSSSAIFLTIVLGALFLVVKYVEWEGKFSHGIFPGSPELFERARGEIIFFGLYFVMTGLHGLHVMAGILVLLYLLVPGSGGRENEGKCILTENTGLYWHFVDVIWIYLFPVVYLIL